MNRRTTRVTVLAVLAVLAAACGGEAATTDAAGTGSEPAATTGTTSTDADDSAPRDVTVMLDWTPNTNHSGLYLAEANGWYGDEGLDVEIIQPGEQGGLPALASGDADFAVSVQEQLLPARAQGAPVVSIAAIIPTNTSSLVMLADEGVEFSRHVRAAGHHRHPGRGSRGRCPRMLPARCVWPETHTGGFGVGAHGPGPSAVTAVLSLEQNT